ncbi:hypothetical protein FRB94_013917 [Tulasnella sp. JGI-2019a]|nr:hypothetical protein FRB93_002386 [Tulasnella sp. JGI-2019a]KAG9007861.1 hypothetical protein FRB94_013917 [Tulasnella sp. JGI-2019a]
MKHFQVFKLEVITKVDLRDITSELPSLTVLSIRNSLGWPDEVLDVDLEWLHQRELCIEQASRGDTCWHGVTCSLNGFLHLGARPYSQSLESLTISVCAAGDFNGVFATLLSLRSLRFQHL